MDDEATDKDVFYINSEFLIKLGINPQDGIDYLLNKKAITLNPAHVKAIQILKEHRPVVTS